MSEKQPFQALKLLWYLGIFLASTSKITADGQNTENHHEEELMNTTERLRQSLQSKTGVLPEFTIRSRSQQYNSIDGVLALQVSQTRFISPVSPKTRSPDDDDNDDSPAGEDPGIRWNVSQLIRHANKNFRTHIHKVRTDDGYILTLFRITNAACKPRSSLPTFFQHGFLGNQYSQEHKNMSTKDPKYWDFSFHEMGLYDLPAAFDYIIRNTGKNRLNYVGYELGTTMFYVCLSQNPVMYNKKIGTMIGLGPLAYMFRTQSPIKFLSNFGDFYHLGSKNGPLVSSTVSSYLRFVQPHLCQVYKHGQSLCSKALALIFGADESKTIGKKVIPRIFGHMPQTTSIKTFVHFLQLLGINQFRQFDYGLAKNMLMYSQPTPPKYNLFLIHTQTVNFYGQQDLLIDPKDVEQTVSELGTGNYKFNVEFLEMEHTSLLYSEYFSAGYTYTFFYYLFGCRDDGTCDNTRISSKPESKCQCPGQCMVESKYSSFSMSPWQEKSAFLQYMNKTRL